MADPKWQKIETEYDFQERAWKHEETGNVVVVEKQELPYYRENGGHYAVFLLDEDWIDNPMPILEIGDFDEVDAALTYAAEWMEENN